MAKSYSKAKGRGDKPPPFLALAHSVLDSSDFGQLSGNAVKVLLSIARQYNGHNNGDLSAPGSKAKPNGIGSENTWYKAIKELIAADLILCTRDPVRNRQNPHGLCALFAITWRNIDECGGKLDVKPTIVPPRRFGKLV